MLLAGLLLLMGLLLLLALSIGGRRNVMLPNLGWIIAGLELLLSVTGLILYFTTSD